MLLQLLETSPEKTDFTQVIAYIDANYQFTPTAFTNGELKNAANENNGSCKVFSFAKLHQLSPEKTLALFGDYYRIDVLEHPTNSDHQNIRNFIKYGWEGISFEGDALTIN